MTLTRTVTSTATTDDSSQVACSWPFSWCSMATRTSTLTRALTSNVDGGLNVVRRRLPRRSGATVRSTPTTTNARSRTDGHVHCNDGRPGQGPGRRPPGDAPEAGLDPWFDAPAGPTPARGHLRAIRRFVISRSHHLDFKAGADVGGRRGGSRGSPAP